MRIISDFELAILNVAEKLLPDMPLQCCLFHLGQSLYWKMQADGLQQAYNDPNNCNTYCLKVYSHMILTFAFVPVEDIVTDFGLLRDDVLDRVLDEVDYFKVT